MEKMLFVLWMVKEMVILWFGSYIFLATILLFFNIPSMPGYVLIVVHFSALALQFALPSRKSRLNNYFVATKVPFRKFKIISQCVNRKNTKHMGYEEILRDIKRSSVGLGAKLQPGYYRTITHTVILNHLQKHLTKIDGTIKSTYMGDISLEKPMKNLLKRHCYNRLLRENKIRDETTAFYYIEFHVPEKNP